MRSLFFHPLTVEIERKRRIKLSVWAYAYELKNVSIVSDAVFDSECLKVDLSINTGRADLDAWWRREFDPSTGQWIHKHPELKRIEVLYDKFYKPS